jgi:MinD superfamily P-loop ATPase
MKELVIISGKGGTGKTSLTASLAALAAPAALADCDVDAADLHLLLAPTRVRTEPFHGGHVARIRQEDCIRCGACLARCRFGAIRKGAGRAGEADFMVDPIACEGCGVCVWTCPVKAIAFPEERNGEWFVSNTHHGPLAHARLNPGGENSGKLVSRVRETARELAAAHGLDRILIDGPPGVGCAVIASVTGASLALAVTEPTVSGAHDLARVLELTRHFRIPTAVCVNKWDLNPHMADRIEHEADQAGAIPAGRLRYDRAATAAQIQGRSVVEAGDSALARDIRNLWDRLRDLGPTPPGPPAP